MPRARSQRNGAVRPQHRFGIPIVHNEDDWISILRIACQATSQATVAKTIGYSAATVSQVLNGSYQGDTKRVQQAVEGALMGMTVECPVIGDLRRDRCLDYQRQPFASTNPLRVQLSITCPGCNHKRGVA